ncbi:MULTISPECIES: LysR family transcriptional regulator [Cupriavidus]|uniref:LysR family transcriptional regulator n=1 Tax=Cupriavidus pauculus TaxID=82633 RepID=A0A5P2HB64_9BURK|nr:LysR family transcriptional regulator [Cupriavidus pauculus]QET04685.1 LysR family transcriptional regulator [Cupriavidus pauculus]
MDKARVLTLFLGVVRAKSFAQAAVEAGVTPQAVSKAVRTLEDELGVRLLHRTTRKLSLTTEGARLFELADPGMRQLDEALEQVRSSRAEDDGMLRLTAPHSVAVRVLVPLIRQFRQQYPGITFDVVASDLFTDLVESRIDVGFRAGTSPGQNLVARKLCDLPLLICASPEYLARHGEPKRAEDLQRHQCTGFRRPVTGRTIPWELTIDGDLVYLEVPAVATFNDVETEIEAVRAGIGIGQLSAYMVQEDLAAGRLVAILPQYDSNNVGLYMYYPHRTHMPVRVRRFIDFVVAASGGPGDRLLGLGGTSIARR